MIIFLHLVGNSTVVSDFDWLNVLGGGEKQTDHSVSLGECQNLKVFSQNYFYVNL